MSGSRRGIRIFAIIWAAITILMGAGTFIAIYFVYGLVNEPRNITTASNAALPLPQAMQPASVAQPVATAAPAWPTLPPTSVAPAIVVAGPDEQRPPPTPLPVSDRSFRPGIQVQVSPDLNPDNQETWMREVANKLRLRWYKQQVRWEHIEAEQNRLDWAALDLSLPLAAEYNLNVMLSIVTAPAWARDQNVDHDRHGPPARNEDYVDFVTSIVSRYPGMVHAIEVWNEQNLDREWTAPRGLIAADYIDLLRDTTLAVKALDPGIIIISGALAPTGGWTEPDGRISAIDDFVYFDSMVNAGLLNYADCIGAHHNGYNIGPDVPWNEVANDPYATFRGPFDNLHHSWSFYSTLRTYADKIKLAGGDQPLCVTEFGWASTEGLDGHPPGFEFANDNTPEEQSRWTIQALDLMKEWGDIWLAFIWNFNYGPQAGWDPNNDNVPYSIIGKDWVFRPLYDDIGAWQLERRLESADSG
ncbi:MAG: hypothetical protein OXG07_11460 [Anaerolineaceae bacterium]|nr:hypothetical protein [Anaerolineaceae bacterium]